MKKDIENRADIENLVNTFYQKVQKDDLIAFFFDKVAQLNWEAHLPKMYDFWEMVIFGKGNFRGNPMRVHLDLHQKQKLEKKHCERWLLLFTTTVDELFEGQKAHLVKTRALSIATVIQMKTFSMP